MAYEVRHQGSILAVIGHINDINGHGWHFSKNVQSPLQWGIGNHPAGYEMGKHIHIERDRIAKHKTIEFLYLIEGKMEMHFYSNEKNHVAMATLVPGSYVCMYDGGHEIKILELTKLIEVKNGPFVDTMSDKERF